MPPPHKVSTAKDSPVVKDLYGQFVQGKLAEEDKPSNICKSIARYNDIDANNFCTAFNKAKKSLTKHHLQK